MSMKDKDDSKVELNQLECLVRLQRIMFPKNGYESGDFAIVTVKVLEVYKGSPKVHPLYKTITLKGNLCKMEEDLTYKIIGVEGYNEQYKSYEYFISYSQEVFDFNTIENQRVFLARILTDSQIGSLYQALDNPIQALEEKNVEALCSAKGIGLSVADRLIERFHDCKDYSKAYIELENYELTDKMIRKLVSHYGSPDTVVHKVKENPYILATEIDGIGFLKADQIALRGGFSQHSIHRCKAYIMYYLEQKANMGDSYVDTDDVVNSVTDTLGNDFPSNVIGDALRSLAKMELWHNTDKTLLALRRIYELERNVAKNVMRLHEAENVFNYDNWVDKVRKQEEKQGWSYTDEQLEGIKATLEENVVLITGLAGTGKSSSVAGMLSVLGEELVFHQTALSGKASVNLTDVTGVDGYTIHRLLGYNPRGGFTYNSEFQLDTQTVILDEFSMVDAQLFVDLLRAIPTGAKLIMLGDSGQLESIGVGNVMHDLIESGAIKCVNLTKVHRQASKSAIITESINVRNSVQIVDAKFEGTVTMGELQDLEVTGFIDSPYRQSGDDKATVRLIVDKFKEVYREVGSIEDIIVVLPMKSRGTSTYKINQLLQRIVLPVRMMRGVTVNEGSKESYTLYVGDRVINRKNDYRAKHVYMGKDDFDMEVEMKDEKQIFNGNMGTVKEVNHELNSIVVDFESVGLVTIPKNKLSSIELGYAITCHSAQGSGIKHVICGLDYTHYNLLTREMVYTMMTRAKKKCYLIVETKALRKATSTTNIRYKSTFLPYFLDGSLDINKPCKIEEDK